MLLHVFHDLGQVALLGALDLGAEAHGLLVHAALDDLIHTVERAAADEEDVRRVHLDELLLRVLASALRRDVCDRALEQLEQRLLHALAGDVARDGRVLALAGDLVDLVDVNDAALCALDVKVRRLQELEQDVLYILADIAGLGERSRVRDGKRHIEHLGQGLGKERLAAAGRADEQNIALLQLDIVILIAAQDALIVVVHRHGQHHLGTVLADDIVVERGAHLGRLRQLVAPERDLRRGDALGLIALIDDAHAQAHALITDIDAVAGNEPVHQRLRFAAKRAAHALFLVISGHKNLTFSTFETGRERRFPPLTDYRL